MYKTQVQAITCPTFFFLLVILVKDELESKTFEGHSSHELNYVEVEGRKDFKNIYQKLKANEEKKMHEIVMKTEHK